VHKKTVLYCAPIDEIGNSGRYIIDGIEQLGYTVIGYDYRSNKTHEKDLSTIISERRPDYFFTQKGEILKPELIKKAKTNGCTTIFWCFDTAMGNWYLPLAKEHDFVLTNVEYHVFCLQKKGIKNVKWMHQGFSPNFFGVDAFGQNAKEHKQTYYADVAMIGSMGNPMYNNRCQLAMRLRREKIDFKWWGGRIARQPRNLRCFLGGIHRSWAGTKVYMQDFADVVRHIKIFIGQDADNVVQEGRYLSNRSFAVLGCGGFYLGRKTPGLEHAFKIGAEIETFESEEEMLEKVRYYLKNEDKRQQIAKAGQKKVLEDYTYKKQIAKIFDWVNANI